MREVESTDGGGGWGKVILLSTQLEWERENVEQGKNRRIAAIKDI